RDDVVGSEALDRVAEGVQEHPAAELPVGAHVQPRIKPPLNNGADRAGLALSKLSRLLLSPPGLERRMSPPRQPLPRAPPARRAKERADDLGARWVANASRLHRHDG